LVRSILTYQLQSLGSVGLDAIAVFDRNCLRRIIRGYNPPSPTTPYWTLWSNAKVHKVTNTEPIELFLRNQRLKWAGHVARKPIDEIVVSVMEELKVERPEPCRSGGQRKQWTKTILEDLGEQSVKGIKDWDRIKSKARDRGRWTCECRESAPKGS
jgi:hypothetical protein